MNAPMVARALPRVRRNRANTIFVGIFVFSRAAVMPNDARMKKITLLMKFPHTPMVVAPVAASVTLRNGRTPNAGRSAMITRPEMATGTGSVTQRKMPATMRASAIFPAKERPSGVGASQPSATMAQAIPKQAKRFLSEGPVEGGHVFSIADRSPSSRLANETLGTCQLPASQATVRVSERAARVIIQGERSIRRCIEKSVVWPSCCRILPQVVGSHLRFPCPCHPTQSSNSRSGGLHTHFSMGKRAFSDGLAIPNAPAGGTVGAIGKQGPWRKGADVQRGRIRTV